MSPLGASCQPALNGAHQQGVFVGVQPFGEIMELVTGIKGHNDKIKHGTGVYLRYDAMHHRAADFDFAGLVGRERALDGVRARKLTG